MVKLTIDGLEAHVADGSTILEAIESVGLSVPRLCYWKNLNKIGACRMCVVEIEGRERLAASCDVIAEEDMVIHTGSQRVLDARRVNLQLILSQHNVDCKNCVRTGNCSLQSLLRQLKMKFSDQPYDVAYERCVIDEEAVLRREADKCVKCMRCIQVCERTQTVNVWRVSGTGAYTTVGTVGKAPLEETNCTYCGQCVVHCPVGALTTRDDTQRASELLANEELTLVAQVSPVVRASCAAEFGIDPELENPGRFTAALRKAGFKYVFETNDGVELMAEQVSKDFIERRQRNEKPLVPLFTSNCPSWKRFIKTQFPDFIDDLTTAELPERLFATQIRKILAEKDDVAPETVRVVSIVPCMSRKTREDFLSSSDETSKLDGALTTRGIVRLLKLKGWERQDLPLQKNDKPIVERNCTELPEISGGTLQTVLKHVYRAITNEFPFSNQFIQEVPCDNPWKEFTASIPGFGEIRAAAVAGLINVRTLMDALKRGKVAYDLVEVLACPQGCVGGGGQLIHECPAYEQHIENTLLKLGSYLKD